MSLTRLEEAERLECVKLAIKEMNRRIDKVACEFWAEVFKTLEYNKEEDNA